MRKKTIAAIFSVYFVICAAYGISRSAAQSDEQTVQVTGQTAVQTSVQTSVSVPSTEDSGAKTTTKSSQQTAAVDDDDDEPAPAVTAPSETTITQQTQPDAPSLDEYLKKLRCSGCRHNCSLASPRCMNGRRKASNAESEYYSIYG